MVEIKLHVLNEGNPKCSHPYVYYINNALDGQTFWCDIPGCERHEKMDYSPNVKIPFPPNAYIRTPNPMNGGEDFYSFKSDQEGIVKSILPLGERINRKDLKLEEIVI